MEISEAFEALLSYDLWLVFIGVAVLVTAVLPRLLSKYPLSMPIVLLGLGCLSTSLPLGLEAPDPIVQGDWAEHLTELGVIIALMGAGLRIDRPPSLAGWNSTWRLLGITMILSIALAAWAGWWIAGFVPASAVLFGAIISPTDPVLASDVQVGAPGEGSEDAETEEIDETGPGEEDEIRFALTSEAGLNDGLVFPFTNMAVAMALAGAAPANWIDTWLLVDVGLKIGIALVMSFLLGHFLARLLLAMPARTFLAKAMVGISAVAATLIVYGTTEYVGGYGFIATFVAAVIIRNHQQQHEYHDMLHMFSEQSERLLTAGVLVALGAAIGGGLLEPLTWPLVLTALVTVFIVRPVSGILGLTGLDEIPWRERLAISFFGVRGIGSLYYLSYALNEAYFPESEELWALTGMVIVVSVLVHGITAAPVTEKLDALRAESQ